jgi:cyanate lyase
LIRWTRLRLDHAIKLRDSGLSWAEVAERLGTSANNVEVNVCLYRKGKKTFAAERKAARNAEIERLYLETDLSLAKIAPRVGLSAPGVYLVLAARGLDAETRAEERELRKAA